MTIFPFVKQIIIFSHNLDTYSSMYTDQCKRSTYKSGFFSFTVYSQSGHLQTFKTNIRGTFLETSKQHIQHSTGKAWLLLVHR